MRRKPSKKVVVGPPNLTELPPFDPMEFRWPVEWVEEIADRLANKDGDLSEQADKRPDYWKQLGHAAIRYLDRRRDGCLDAIRERGARDTYFQGRKFIPLPPKMSFAEAVKFITREFRNDRALPAFESFLTTLVFENRAGWQRSTLQDIPRPATLEAAKVAAKDWMKHLQSIGDVETIVATDWMMHFGKHKEAKVSKARQTAAQTGNKKRKKSS